MSPPRPLLRHSQLPLIRTGTAPVFEFLPNGTLHAVRANNILLNLILGCPVGGSLHRIALSVFDGTTHRPILLAGPGSEAKFSADATSACWDLDSASLKARATLQPFEGGWSVEISLTNSGFKPLSIEAVHGLDLSLTTQFAARLNESYASQYIDHRDLPDETLLRAVASRQNLPVDGKYPWLIQSWVEGTDGFTTDGSEFFGRPLERENGPIALLDPPYPGRVLQDESAYVALFSTPLELPPGATGGRTFIAVFRDHHPEASHAGDVEVLHAAIKSLTPSIAPEADARRSPAATTTVHGKTPTEPELRAWFQSDWTAVEHRGGTIASFFHGPDREHVVSKAKEAHLARPHALILRSGSEVDGANDVLDTTCHMNGVFQSLMSVGHPSFHRLLSPVRERLGLLGASGQRIGFRTPDGITWLGIPSTFAMSLTACRWIYRLENHIIKVITRVSTESPEATTTIRLIEGESLEFVISHGLVGGEREGEEDATLTIDGTLATIEAGPDSLAKKYFPNARFAVEAIDPSLIARVGGSELLGFDHAATTHLVFETKPALGLVLKLSGSTRPLPAAVGKPVWSAATSALRVSAAGETTVDHLDSILPWFIHNGIIHYSVPHGLEQWNGGAWGVRDVTQGSVELLLTIDRSDIARATIADVFLHQYDGSGDWPQWYMLAPFGWIQQRHSHGDIPLWPLKALCEYLEATSDFAFLDEAVDWTDANTARPIGKPSSILDHAAAAVAWMRQQCFPGTALLRYGEGDWDDSLQPARPELREHMVSAWTVALSYQVLRRLETLEKQSGKTIPGVAGFADAVKEDFHRWLLPDGIACGFFVFDDDGKSGRPLLHPADTETGIHHRLLPMKRAIISGLFTKEEAVKHLAIIRQHLLAADGARLMDRPTQYRGGPRNIFERAESSAAFSREIGVFYTHAHLRYLEMLSILGEADALWHGLQQINPVGVTEAVPHALPRQANLYFSSSDAQVHDRYEAAERYPEIVEGKVPVAGGWRLYSSGPGIFCHLVRSRILGIRRHYDRLTLDPILPSSLPEMTATMLWEGHDLKVIFRHDAPTSETTIILNGTTLESTPCTENPYRTTGRSLDVSAFNHLLVNGPNILEITLPQS